MADVTSTTNTELLNNVSGDDKSLERKWSHNFPTRSDELKKEWT